MARASAAEWSKRVKRWRRSGLTAREFAAKAGLKASTLTYWSWRLKSDQPAAVRAHRAEGNGTMVELEVASIVASPPIEIALADGRHVRVPRGADEATLSMVVRVLEAAR